MFVFGGVSVQNFASILALFSGRGEVMPKRQWQIICRSGTAQVWERVLPASEMSERQMRDLLARLASRHLSEDEVISASLGGRSKSRDQRLYILPEWGVSGPLFTTGDPHYVAKLEKV